MSTETDSPFLHSDRCLAGCEAKLHVADEAFYVCKDNLGKISGYFRVMFFNDFKEKKEQHFEIRDETPDDVLRFLELTEIDPNIAKITDETLENLIRLANLFQAPAVKNRLNEYITTNADSRPSTQLLDWLIWSVTYCMPQASINACLPGVACLWLYKLSENRQSIGSELYGSIVEAKLKNGYTNVGKEGHRRAHFSIPNKKSRCGSNDHSMTRLCTGEGKVKSRCEECHFTFALCKCTIDRLDYVCANCSSLTKFSECGEECRCMRAVYKDLLQC